MTASEVFKANANAFHLAREQVKAEVRSSEALRELVQEYRAAIGAELAALGCTAEDAISWKAKRILQRAGF